MKTKRQSPERSKSMKKRLGIIWMGWFVSRWKKHSTGYWMRKRMRFVKRRGINGARIDRIRVPVRINANSWRKQARWYFRYRACGRYHLKHRLLSVTKPSKVASKKLWLRCILRECLSGAWRISPKPYGARKSVPVRSVSLIKRFTERLKNGVSSLLMESIRMFLWMAFIWNAVGVARFKMFPYWWLLELMKMGIEKFSVWPKAVVKTRNPGVIFCDTWKNAASKGWGWLSRISAWDCTKSSEIFFLRRNGNGVSFTGIEMRSPCAHGSISARS